MVVVSSMTYEVIGSWMARMTPFNLLWTSIIAYIAVASLIAAVFSYVKSAVGKKVVGSDVFGGAEYVLGALSGMLRAFCVVLMLISVMNSMYVSKEKRAKLAKVQRENFGTISFPSLGSLQEDIFVNSFSGPYIHHYLSDQLMHPIKLEHKKKSNVATQREDTINNIIKKK